MATSCVCVFVQTLYKSIAHIHIDWFTECVVQKIVYSHLCCVERWFYVRTHTLSGCGSIGDRWGQYSGVLQQVQTHTHTFLWTLWKLYTYILCYWIFLFAKQQTDARLNLPREVRETCLMSIHTHAKANNQLDLLLNKQAKSFRVWCETVIERERVWCRVCVM